MAPGRLASRLVAALLAASALASARPASSQPKPKPVAPPTKTTDMEIDPDAKPAPPPEEKPLPPPEPGQWGVGGKDEEGKFAPGTEKKEKDEAAKKAKVEEEKPVGLGPERAFNVDWVTGFGSIHDITNDASGTTNGKTLVTSMSFLFSFSLRFAEIWTVGARFPFSQASLAGPGNGTLGATDVAKTIAPGNLEIYARPSFQLTPRLRLPAQVSFYFPSGQGDLLGDTTQDYVAVEQALVNMAASAARGWEEMPLFFPHRFGFRAAPGITYDTESIHFAAGTGIDLMAKVGGNDPGPSHGRIGTNGQGGLVRSTAYAWVTKASFFYGFAVGPGFIEPGLRAWLTYAKLPWYLPVSDDSGPQFVLEPAVNARFALNEAKSLWINSRLGFIAPVAGPLGNSPVVGASIKGFRVNAEFGF
jgi:hypothetical protein